MFDLLAVAYRIKKNVTKGDLFLITIIITLYLATRLINIEALPIFTDEGIYIHWAKVAWHDASWRFISLTDGRQPLQTWATIPLLKLFPDNAFLAGRLFGVVTGAIAAAGIFTILYYLFGKKAAYIGSFFYIFTPYFLFYDRLALMDSGINAAFIWILFFSLLLVNTLRLDVALIFGMICGLSLLAKSSTQLFVAMSGIAPLVFFEKNLKKNLAKFLNFYFLFSLVVILTVAIYNIQRLSPFLHFVAEKNKTFILTLPELLKNPFSSFNFNIYIIPYYVLSESGFFLPVVGSLGWLLLLKNNRRLGFYLTFWLLIPYIIISFVARVLYPRYIILFASLFTIFISYLLTTVSNKRNNIVIIVLALFSISVAYFDYTILFDYKNIPFPEIDRGQYIEGGSSGSGIKEIVEYARSRAKEKPAVIVAEGNFGMAGDVLDVFLRRNDKVFIKSYWPLTIENILENQKELEKNQVFVVFVYQKNFPASWPLQLIKKFEKPAGKSAIYLFALTKPI